MQLNITWSYVFRAYVLIDDDGNVLTGRDGPLEFDTKRAAFEWVLINHKKVEMVLEFLPGRKGATA